jgi:Immunity protein 26
MSSHYKGIKAKVGDIFLIPLTTSCFAVGHLIAIRDQSELYIAIFGKKMDHRDTNWREIINQDPKLLCLTLDAKIFHGKWPIIGSSVDTFSNYLEPVFRVIDNGVPMIESRDRTFRRSATENEMKELKNRIVSSPMLVENATKAFFGICDWQDSYDKFLAKNVEKSLILVRKHES